MPRRLLLTNHQSPGDILMLTAAVRDLHRCYPGEFITDVRTSCPAFWYENPYLTPLEESDPEVEVIDCHYPLIQLSNRLPHHFLFGFIEYLNGRLGLNIKPTAFHGDIHLHEEEKRWMPQVMEFTGEDTPYWIIVAGGKEDYTIKWWSAQRWQEVVDRFRGRIQFVQVGHGRHQHPALDGVIDLRGKTDLRQLVRLVHHAQGVVCPVTSLMHLAAAVPVRPGRAQNRACVIVAGGREPAAWEAYTHHQFIHTNGQLLCCDQGGCWKSRTTALGDGAPQDAPEQLCVQPVAIELPAGSKSGQSHEYLPRCMEMISAAEVVRRIEGYFHGGASEYLTAAQAATAEKAITGKKSTTIHTGATNGHHPASPRPVSPKRHRMIGVTIGVGEKWQLLARLAAESFTESTGLEAFVLGEEAMKRHGFATPHHLKYKLFHEFPDADSIVYFDADIIFLQPFDATAFAERREFFCVRDLYETENVIREEARTLRLRSEDYFNSGFFIVQRAVHSVFLEKAQWLTGRIFSRFRDQSFLNGARHMLGSPIVYLPREYNKLGFDIARDTSRIVVGHFHLIDRRPMGEIEAYHHEWRAKGRVAFAQHGAEIQKKLKSILEQPEPIPPIQPLKAAEPDTSEEARYRVLLEREIAAKRIYPKNRFAGRGIVICGGGAKYFPCAWVTVKLLRHHGCQLPIELWYLGPSEMTPAMAELLEPLGVRTIDALELRHRQRLGPLRGWELKAYALLYCQFAEVLLLDSDNAPVRDPEYLFDDPAYREKGAIFWPDFGSLPKSSRIWAAMGLEYRHEPAFESGQIVIDKAKCWKALRLAMHLNDQSAFYYKLIHGDKDTFHMAWARLGQPYAMTSKRLEALEATMCQHDLQGKRIFQHRNADKWRIDGRNRNIPGFYHEAVCLQFLEELRTLWFPLTLGVRRWNAAEASPALRTTARALVQTPWDYHRVGHDRRQLRLQADGLIGEGGEAQEFYWHLRPSPSGPVLEFFNTNTRTCRLLRGKDGVWRGRWDICEQMPIELSRVRVKTAPPLPLPQERRKKQTGLKTPSIDEHFHLGEVPIKIPAKRQARSLPISPKRKTKRPATNGRVRPEATADELQS